MTCRSTCRPCVAVLLPGAGGGNPSPEKPSRLIIPGGRSTPSRSPSGLLQGTQLDDAADTKRTYRPPMGYFVKKKDPSVTESVATEVMLQRLQSGVGRWHVLATYLPQLNSDGMDSQLIEDMTGIPKKEQSILVTAASVLRSIALYCEENQIPGTESMLEFFDTEGTHFALYQLRFLDVEDRMQCAEYVARHQLHAQDTEDLARSTKEYHRRGGEDTGFQPTPEDILAFKFYRNALESREEELIASFVEKGLKVAQSTEAKEKLEAVLSGHEKLEDKKGASVHAKIHIYRLLSNEILYRPVPYAGELSEVDREVLENCPKARTSGAFNVFDIEVDESSSSSHRWKWMTLPRWPLFAYAKRPVALSIKNCAKLEELRSSIHARSKEDALKLSGPGMLIVDVSERGVSDEPCYHLIADASGKVKLTTTQDVSDSVILAKVLFVCRPPDEGSEF